MKIQFLKNGFTKISNFIPLEEVLRLKTIYNDLLNDKEKTKGFRSDLSGSTEERNVEKITQIMRPSLLDFRLSESQTYKLAKSWAKEFLGNDMELDFDMLINKAPKTDTETPWHQDAAYWIEMPDKRSLSIWIALDDVFEENGCMWFIPKKENQEIISHTALPNGGALFCEINSAKAKSVPLKMGSCTFHDGFTFHYSKGNSTEFQRRALILNFRPKEMILLERSKGIDHTGNRELRNKKGS